MAFAIFILVRCSRLFIVPLLTVSLLHLVTHVSIYHLYEDRVDSHTHVPISGKQAKDHADTQHQDPRHSEDPLNADANHCVAGLLHLSEIVTLAYNPIGVMALEGLVVSLAVRPITTDLIASSGRAPPASFV